jgi:choline kinase
VSAVRNAVIAAAGLGSRLGHGLPKCMLELQRKTILSRLIEALEGVVDRIHVVVGYREELVINLCSNLHRKVVIVRNPAYRTTNTVQSMALGAKGLNGKTLFLDGDLIIEPASLFKFLDAAQQHSVLVGIAPSQSENPVNVSLTETDCKGPSQITAFTREPGYQYEWANVVAGPARMLDDAAGYVYERLEKDLPLPCSCLNLREIDTIADLESAKRFVIEISEDR